MRLQTKAMEDIELYRFEKLMVELKETTDHELAKLNGIMMTSDEILSEPAGPRLDAFVAEHVMGWTRHDIYYWIDAKGDLHPVCGFRPSRDIAAAWQVMEKLVGICPERFSFTWKSNGRWLQGEFRSSDGDVKWRCDFNGLPSAEYICKCALVTKATITATGPAKPAEKKRRTLRPGGT